MLNSASLVSRVRWSVGILSLSLVLNAVCGQSAVAGGFQIVSIEQLTTNGLNPQISGSRVVWEGTGGTGAVTTDREVFLWQNGVVTQLTNNGVHDLNARVSSAGVLWERGTGTASEIMFHNGVSETQLTTNSVADTATSLSGTRAAWMQGAGNAQEIMLWNGTTTTNLGAPGVSDRLVHVKGDQTVWLRGSVPNIQVMKNDGTGAPSTVLATHAFAVDDPKVDGNHVVWQASNGSTSEIFMHDGANVHQLTTNAFNDFDPQVSGGVVTWWGGVFNNNQVYVWENGVTTQLSNSGLNQFPQIDGRFVVWQGTVGSASDDLEIFLWDGSQVHQITDNSVADTVPQISGNRIVWQSGGGIYMATFVVPEPSSIALAALAFAGLIAVALRRRVSTSRS